MKRAYWMGALAALVALMPPARAAGEGAKDTAELVQSAKALKNEVEALFDREKVRSRFDMMRKLKAYGISYQPDLTAPVDLAGRLIPEDQRTYAGIKLFDAIYAATFLKRQETADSIRAIEEVEDALDLRSYADLSRTFLKTLKQAAAEPENIDTEKLLSQLADDYVDEIPALMSSEETARYLIEGLYGFTIQTSHVLGFFYRQAITEVELDRGVHAQNDTSWLYAILDIFSAYHRIDRENRSVEEAEERLAVIRQMLAAIEGERDGTMSEEEQDAAWAEIAGKVDRIRSVVLTPVPAP